MRRTISPATYRRVTSVAVFALAFIVVTGASVRLTGSGLGCSDWPTCEQGRLVAPWEYHAMVEFTNRLVTGLVSVAVVLAVLGSLRREPRRADLVRLSLGLVAGVLGQIVLGGLTVLFHLAPPLVMAHFLLSMLILWDAIVLHQRAAEDDTGPAGTAKTPLPPPVVRLVRAVLGATAAVLVTGTVVTASGPHGGDERAPRFAFALRDVARVHAGAVWVLVILTIAVTLVAARSSPAARRLRTRAHVLLGVLLVQGTIGYVQYFSGVPVLLVGAHVVGAVAVWSAAVHLHAALRDPVGTRALVAPEVASATGSRPVAAPAGMGT